MNAKEYLFFDALWSFVSISNYTQQEYSSNTNYNSMEFLKNFCTIRMSCCRSAGHTAAISQLLIYTQWRSLLFFPTIAISKNFDYSSIKKHHEYYKQVNIFPFDAILKGYNFVGLNISQNYDAVIIDNSAFLSSVQEHALYSQISINYNPSAKPFFIIFIQ